MPTTIVVMVPIPGYPNERRTDLDVRSTDDGHFRRRPSGRSMLLKLSDRTTGFDTKSLVIVMVLLLLSSRSAAAFRLPYGRSSGLYGFGRTTAPSMSSLLHAHAAPPPNPKPLPSPPSLASLPSIPLSSALSNGVYATVVVGGGHAGCEAAAAACRALLYDPLGSPSSSPDLDDPSLSGRYDGSGGIVLLLTQRVDTVGEMSCNPSIGGVGKGHLVTELSALGGVMPGAADEACIHFRMLNRSKGQAVRGPRGQMDRTLYKSAVQSSLSRYVAAGVLHVLEGAAEDIVVDDDGRPPSAGEPGAERDPRRPHRGRLAAVVVRSSDGGGGGGGGGRTATLPARSAIITTGTFLSGVLHLGQNRYAGGRHLRDSEKVEPPSVALAQTLDRLGFDRGRLKTGTPPRLDGRTIDWSSLSTQPSETGGGLGFDTLVRDHGAERQGLQRPTLPNEGRFITCYKTETNERTHKLVLGNAHLLPVYDGADGGGEGPRYCPSIYKKCVRFQDKASHNSFLEPEGLDTHVVYPNGMSGPYPPEVQQQIINSMKGLEKAVILNPGYDVEYDFVNPQTLTHTLESKSVPGLYLAGQICGTTGYEEAGALGLVAGANAGRRAGCEARGLPPPLPFVVGRDEGYIGVLVDDLVERGTKEPYRMFTSRAEYRLSLRADNADSRLTAKGVLHGLVKEGGVRHRAHLARVSRIESSTARLHAFSLLVRDWQSLDAGMGGKYGLDDVRGNGARKTAAEVLLMPAVELSSVEAIMRSKSLSPESFEPTHYSAADTVEADVKYSRYMIRQEKEMDSWRRSRELAIPGDIVFDAQNFPAASAEELQKLGGVVGPGRPGTFADAQRINGITPQTLVFLYHYVLKRGNDRDRKRAEGAAVLLNPKTGAR